MCNNDVHSTVIHVTYKLCQLRSIATYVIVMPYNYYYVCPICRYVSC